MTTELKLAVVAGQAPVEFARNGNVEAVLDADVPRTVHAIAGDKLRFGPVGNPIGRISVELVQEAHVAASRAASQRLADFQRVVTETSADNADLRKEVAALRNEASAASKSLLEAADQIHDLKALVKDLEAKVVELTPKQ